MQPNIVLIGLSGSGKSTTSRLIAARLGWGLVDTDSEIERDEGLPITAIFATRGEPAFRAIEAQAIARAMGSERSVIATGGGAVLLPENRAALWARGFVAYLRGTPVHLAERLRTQGADDRPLVAGDIEQRLQSLLDARSQYYEQAHAIIDTDGLTPDAVAEQVVSAYEQAG